MLKCFQPRDPSPPDTVDQSNDGPYAEQAVDQATADITDDLDCWDGMPSRSTEVGSPPPSIVNLSYLKTLTRGETAAAVQPFDGPNRADGQSPRPLRNTRLEQFHNMMLMPHRSSPHLDELVGRPPADPTTDASQPALDAWDGMPTSIINLDFLKRHTRGIRSMSPPVSPSTARKVSESAPRLSRDQRLRDFYRATLQPFATQ